MWGEYNLTGEVAQTLSEGLYTKEEIDSGQEVVPKPPLTTKERHEAVYEVAKRELAQAARSFNSFFLGPEAKEVNRIFRKIEQDSLELEQQRLFLAFKTKQLAELKLKLNQEVYRDKTK